MKFAAVVILYNPTELEINNINSYNKFVDEIFIFDNSENSNNEEILNILELKNFSYIKNDSNEGLCKPLNKAINFCIEKEYDFLLTMDQDSYFLEGNISKYIEDIKKFQDLDLVGQFGLWYKKHELQNNGSLIFEARPYLITSSSVININTIKKHNIYFDENLFIDSVDFSFSFDITLKGLKNILFSDNYFVHKLGEPIKRASYKTLYLIKKKKYIHSPLRIYYMKRNSLYLEKKYFNSTMEVHAKNIREGVTKYVKKCLNYSKNPLEIYTYIKYIKKAEKDFNNNSMGKIKE